MNCRCSVPLQIFVIVSRRVLTRLCSKHDLISKKFNLTHLFFNAKIQQKLCLNPRQYNDIWHFEQSPCKLGISMHEFLMKDLCLKHWISLYCSDVVSGTCAAFCDSFPLYVNIMLKNWFYWIFNKFKLLTWCFHVSF